MHSQGQGFNKDIRFWLLIAALGVLLWITVANYPGIG
jgi:hypothetical protein